MTAKSPYLEGIDLSAYKGDVEEDDQKWNDMGNGTHMKSLFGGGIILVAPDNLKQSVVPLFCPMCEFPMKTREDGHSFRKMNCCERCDMRWGASKNFLQEDFELVKKTSEWKEYIEDRLNRSRQLIKLK